MKEKIRKIVPFWLFEMPELDSKFLSGEIDKDLVVEEVKGFDWEIARKIFQSIGVLTPEETETELEKAKEELVPLNVYSGGKKLNNDANGQDVFFLERKELQAMKDA